MEDTGLPPVKEGVAAEVRHAVREELGHLQEWMADWRNESSQLLQLLIAQQEARALPTPAGFQRRLPPLRSRRMPTKQSDTSSVANSTGILSRQSTGFIEGDHDPPASRPPHGEDAEMSEHSLPNVVHAFPTDVSSGASPRPARGQSKPRLNSTLSFETAASREQARAQWTQHLHNRVTELLESEEQRRTTVWRRLPTIKRISVSRPPCTEVISGSIRVVVRHRAFQSCCAAIVIFNLVFTGYTTDFSMSQALAAPPYAVPAWFEDVNVMFTAFYCIELLLRLFAFGGAFFTGPDRKWHAFDTVLVATSLVEHLLQGVDMSITTLRVIRGLRVARVLQIIRVMRFCRDLRLMVSSIMQSLSALTWALLLLLIIMYLFTVVFMQGVIMYLEETATNGEFDNMRGEVLVWYGSIWRTMYTLLASIVGGVDWTDVVIPLEKMSMVYRLIFCFYILFMVIGVLNVLTGIFVERACELSGLDRDLVIQGQMTRDEAFRVEMKKIFEEADVDGSGKMTWEKFRTYLENDRVKAYLLTQQLDVYDARTLFDMLRDGSEHEIGVETFIVGCERLKGMAKGVDLMAVLQEARTANRRLRMLVRKQKRAPRSQTVAPRSQTVARRSQTVDSWP